MSDRPLRIVREHDGEIIQPGKVAAGWGLAKRKMTTPGHAKTEIARVYRLAAAGRISPEDMAKAIWAMTQFARVCEQADTDERIERLERTIAELMHHGR